MIIYCHPDNVEALRAALPIESDQSVMPAWCSSFCGTTIYTDANLEKERPKPGGWVKHHFPEDPFVEYEERDLDWMEPLGLAWTEREMEMVFFKMVQPSMFNVIPPSEPPKSTRTFSDNLDWTKLRKMMLLSSMM